MLDRNSVVLGVWRTSDHTPSTTELRHCPKHDLGDHVNAGLLSQEKLIEGLHLGILQVDGVVHVRHIAGLLSSDDGVVHIRHIATGTVD